MRIGIFTDSHFSSQEITCGRRYNSRSLEKIKAAYKEFEREGCELVVCLGDLIDTESTVEKEIENLKLIAHVMNESKLRTVCLMGNHDAFVLTSEQFYEALGTDAPEDMKINGKNLIFIDACYFKSGRHYAPGDSDWTDTFLPDLDALREKLNSIDGEAYIFVHQNIDPEIEEDCRIYNADEAREIINKSGVVKAVFQGHNHDGVESEYDGVKYITVPAMCENEEGAFIFEL